MRSVLAGVRLQIWLSIRQPDDFMMLWTIPFGTLIYLSIAVNAGRTDLLPNAVLAPAVIGVWMFSVNLASSIVNAERWQGTLELSTSTTDRLQAVMVGRILTITGSGLLPLAETWLLSWAFFSYVPEVHHPLLFVVTLLLTNLAMAATASLLAAFFVLSRNSTIYTNFLTYPVYILSGVLVPVSYLPGFLEPFSRGMFLYWSTELLRDCLAAAPVADVGPRLAVLAALGAAAFAIGHVGFGAVLRRGRTVGTFTHV